MAKYQFFSIPASNRQQYTFIDMASPTFLIEKAALLAQGFEIEEDFIDAANRARRWRSMAPTSSTWPTRGASRTPVTPRPSPCMRSARRCGGSAKKIE